MFLEISYLSADKLGNFDPVTAEQLKDCAIRVIQRKEKHVLSKMCSTELEFAFNCLMKWFNRKCKSQFLESNLLSKKKKRFENENETDWVNKNRLEMCYFLWQSEMFVVQILRK